MNQVGPLETWQIDAQTVCEVFERAVHLYGDKTYCQDGAGRGLTYAQAFTSVSALADELGEGVRNRTVGLFLPNSMAFLIAYQAVLRAGGRPALLNAAMPKAAVDQLISSMDLDLLLVAEDFSGVPTKVITDQKVLTLGQGPTMEVLPAAAKSDDTSAILFSGGTTGIPKRIAHSHRAMIAKMERIEWGWATEVGETWLPVAPFTHVYGFLMGVVNPVLRGGKVIIPERFKPDVVVDLLAQERVTIFGGGPPAIYQALMSAPNFGSVDLSALRVCPGGGAPFPVATHQQWEAATGLRIYEGLGMTEIAPMAINSEASGFQYGSVGRPCPDTEIQIVDLDQGTAILPAGETGEIRVKGPHLMTEYEGNPEETAASIRDGFLYTGDVGMLDGEGFLIITDRKKDVILHKGFNVFPREVEEVLMGHKGVRQTCVIGRPDEQAGEVVVAFVVANEGVTAESLLKTCQALLTRYKVPHSIVIEETLPLTPNGKLDRIALRARALS